MSSNRPKIIERKTKATNKDLDAIVKISEAIHQSFDLDRILQIALDTVLKLKGLDAGTIRIMDEQSSSLILKAYQGFPLKVIRKLKKIKLGEKFSGLVALTGEPILVHDISTSPWLAEISEARADLKSLASIPLKSRSKIVGSMNIYAPNADHFHEQVMQLLKVIGLQIGIAIENAKLLEMLRQSLKQSEYILRSSPNGIITLDVDGRILSFNEAAERILGFSLEEVRQKTYRDAFTNQPEIIAAIEKQELNQEFIFYKKDGERIYINLSHSPIRDEMGREQGSILNFQDITERKKIDEQIHRIARLLSLGQLAAGIAHEVRNPLSGISYVLDDLHDYLKEDEERRELIERATKEVDRLDRSVSSLLDFSQVNRVDLSYHNVNAILEDAFLWIKNRCQDQEVEVLKEYGEDLPEIMLDPEKLKQAFLNLMINALDAMERGGILKIHTRGYSGSQRNPMEQSKFVEVIIEDSGSGIPIQDQNRIFDPFFTTKAEGSGLGLSITHSIILEHRGKISLESEEGRGSRFTIHLPTSYPRKGGILSVGIESGIDVLDPHTHGGWMTYRVVRNIFEGLVDKDLTLENVAYSPIIPCLAKSWEISSDGLIYTFHLREGVRFHDGTLFDAEAVKFNIDRMTNPKAPQYDPKAAHYSIFIWRYLKAVEVVNPLKVRIHLSQPFSDFLAQLTEGGLGSAKMLCPSSWKRYGSQGIKDHPIGTGPFKFIERGKKGEVILEKNYDYWGEMALLDKLIFKPIPEPATRVAALQMGEVDFIFVPPPDTIDILKKAGFMVIQGPVPHIWFMYLNMRDRKMLDPRVRKAINMAIDKERMAQQLLRGTAKVAHGLQAPGCPSYDPDFFDYEYNPKKAKKLLSEAGYPKGFKMTFQTSTAGSGQLIPVQMAEWIRHDLEKVGIDCKLDLHEWIHYIGLWAKGIQEGVEANQISWGMSSDYWLEIVAHSKNWGPNGRNSGYYKNLKVDELLDAARLEYNEQKRIALYRKANGLITKDTAYVPIVNDLAPIVMNKKVKGFIHPPSEWYDFTTVWVEE
ncbi:MAG: ABC transporter substrate-binding protein [Thermodesulfobacteriota bacterium]